MQNDNMEQNNLNIQSENYSEQPQNPEYVGDYNMYQQPMGDYNYQQAGSFDMQQNYVDPNQMGYVDPNQAYMNTQQKSVNIIQRQQSNYLEQIILILSLLSCCAQQVHHCLNNF